LIIFREKTILKTCGDRTKRNKACHIFNGRSHARNELVVWHYGFDAVKGELFFLINVLLFEKRLPIFNIFCDILSLPLSGCFIVQLLMYLVLLQFFKLFNNEKVFNISFAFLQYTYWNAQLIVTVIYRMLHHKLKWRDMDNSELEHGGSSWSNNGFRSITSSVSLNYSQPWC
jgi:hypothetical protein